MRQMLATIKRTETFFIAIPRKINEEQCILFLIYCKTLITGILQISAQNPVRNLL